METLIPTWQASVLGGVLAWIVVSSMFNVTRIIRSLTQPWVSSCVISGIPIILQIQVCAPCVWSYDNNKFDIFNYPYPFISSIYDFFKKNWTELLLSAWIFHAYLQKAPMSLISSCFSSCWILDQLHILQKYQHPFLDALFTGLSCLVSVPFYTGFLPLLFWVIK